MNIKMIGTGSMWSSSNSACYLINNKILIDIPNGACKAIMKSGLKLSDINHVLITHYHGDHYFDIPFYLLNHLEEDSKQVNIYTSYNDIKKYINYINSRFLILLKR